MLSLLASWSVQILLIALGAVIGSRLVRATHPRVRARFWFAASVLAMAAPFVGVLLRPVAPVVGFEGGRLDVYADSADRALQAAGLDWRAGLLIVWASVASVLVIRLLRGLSRLRAIAREGRPLNLNRVNLEGLDVRETNAVATPSACFLGRVILVPPAFSSHPTVWQRAVLTHERIHLDDGHGVLLVVEEFAKAVFWFHPGLHFLIRHAANSREQMVDAETVARTGHAEEYRDMLIALASKLHLPAPAVSGTTALSVRIQSLDQLEKNTMRPATLRVFAASLTLAAFAAVASASTRVDQADEQKSAAEKKKAGISVAERVKIGNVNPIYPEALKEAKVSALVLLEIVVSADGRVTEVSPLKTKRTAEADPAFVQASVDAVRQWTYQPADKATKMTVALNFRPKK